MRGYTVAPKGKLYTNHSGRKQECSPAVFLFLTMRTTTRRVHTHTCAHFNTTSRAHKPRTKFTHLNREKHSLDEVKTKDTQLSQSWQEALLPALSRTSFLSYDAEPHQLLQPRSTKFTRISSALPQEFTARRQAWSALIRSVLAVAPSSPNLQMRRLGNRYLPTAEKEGTQPISKKSHK